MTFGTDNDEKKDSSAGFTFGDTTPQQPRDTTQDEKKDSSAGFTFGTLPLSKTRREQWSAFGTDNDEKKDSSAGFTFGLYLHQHPQTPLRMRRRRTVQLDSHSVRVHPQQHPQTVRVVRMRRRTVQLDSHSETRPHPHQHLPRTLVSPLVLLILLLQARIKRKTTVLDSRLETRPHPHQHLPRTLVSLLVLLLLLQVRIKRKTTELRSRSVALLPHQHPLLIILVASILVVLPLPRIKTRTAEVHSHSETRTHQRPPQIILLVASILVLPLPRTLNPMEELSISVPLPLLLLRPPLEPHPEVNRRQIMLSTAATMHLEDQIRTQRVETFNSVHHLTHLRLLELRRRQLRLVTTTTTTTHQRQHWRWAVVVCHLA